LAEVISQPGAAQFTTPATILEIDVENIVQYHEDISDVSKFGSDPNITQPVVARNFDYFLIIGDIVAVNGIPVKGTFANTTRTIRLSPAPTSGQAIADVVRATVNNQIFEILQSDGTPVGTITTFGLGGAGPPPPGAPLQVMQGNNAIIGGTGAFLGARGQSGQYTTAQPIPQRAASMAEDPANRRINGGGKARFVQHVIPMSVPEISTTSGGPAVFHPDFSPVSTAKPAKAGEVLLVRATGLGPTVPGVDPGRPFPLESIQQVNSPLVVSVNGKPADVINGIGWPGQVDAYRVDFRIPEGTAPGIAAIQLTAAWITGSSVNIPVQ
jgi:uncharacterized protein (TIGR03437 family)